MKVYREIPHYGRRDPDYISPRECSGHLYGAPYNAFEKMPDYFQVKCAKCGGHFSVCEDQRNKPPDWWRARREAYQASNPNAKSSVQVFCEPNPPPLKEA
jgi:hypothetical protein